MRAVLRSVFRLLPMRVGGSEIAGASERVRRALCLDGCSFFKLRGTEKPIQASCHADERQDRRGSKGVRRPLGKEQPISRPGGQCARANQELAGHKSAQPQQIDSYPAALTRK